MVELHEDLSRIIDRLPADDGECRRVRHLVLQRRSPYVTDDRLAKVLPLCPYLESVVLSGVPDITDRTVVKLASDASNLQGINLSGCKFVTDVGVLELMAKSPPLQWVQLNAVGGLTDPSISAIAKSCSKLVELELCDLPLLTAIAVRDIWSYSRKLRVLRLSRCSLLTDKAFPCSSAWGEAAPDGKPLPHRPVTWLDALPPLFLRHTAENLRVLDLGYCTKITDEAIEGIVLHAPKIQTLVLSGCSKLTDRAVESICKLGKHLDILVLAHAQHVTDTAIVKLARACLKLRSIDLAFCRHLTDMSVFELGTLPNIQRLSLVRVHKLTDNAVYFLAEHTPNLERLHLSYCDRISLDSAHRLMRNLQNLQHLTATGVPSFRRKGVSRFSDTPPRTLDADQQAVFRVFSGENVKALRRFLDKEDQRRREAEVQNIPFVPRSDDKLDLY
ncbi:hypothetical protein SERLA73DRAFT_116413 [Serpula lacrymans var. lacrymans S7.3]|uniref:F-box/LRR-repeat protein 15-like leucin rich repeat domain-containing protein n=2 Tax=Serpula lacrymans var. lacrymans TaxID=341189 RepID=F8QF66_SERL3|nr:uncharacterized protein SERLADRAFT_447081 [Serpula lacrymans var. lacrymans S7.9]EGN93025.1 hypothetical protein SERLA73DRAFT_116413 [Serpula lacrymans var. lacrymans S7.3]EGO27864.1 hypothetical protein SERLADRAFT_447081 [Serpula lacrymans var. lacrymans S7.9]